MRAASCVCELRPALNVPIATARDTLRFRFLILDWKNISRYVFGKPLSLILTEFYIRLAPKFNNTCRYRRATSIYGPEILISYQYHTAKTKIHIGLNSLPASSRIMVEALTPRTMQRTTCSIYCGPKVLYLIC